MQLELHQQAALEFVLKEKYFSEFIIIGSFNRHPDGLNFYQWLYKKKLISKEHLDNWMKEIEEERDED